MGSAEFRLEDLAGATLPTEPVSRHDMLEAVCDKPRLTPRKLYLNYLLEDTQEMLAYTGLDVEQLPRITYIDDVSDRQGKGGGGYNPWKDLVTIANVEHTDISPAVYLGHELIHREDYLDGIGAIEWESEAKHNYVDRTAAEHDRLARIVRRSDDEHYMLVPDPDTRTEQYAYDVLANQSSGELEQLFATAADTYQQHLDTEQQHIETVQELRTDLPDAPSGDETQLYREVVEEIQNKQTAVQQSKKQRRVVLEQLQEDIRNTARQHDVQVYPIHLYSEGVAQTWNIHCTGQTDEEAIQTYALNLQNRYRTTRTPYNLATIPVEQQDGKIVKQTFLDAMDAYKQYGGTPAQKMEHVLTDYRETLLDKYSQPLCGE